MSIFKATAALEKTAANFQAYLDALDDRATVYTANLDTVDGAAFYHFDGSSVGNPFPNIYDGRLIHIEQGNGEASQIAIISARGLYFRDRDRSDSDPNQVWGAWVSIYEPTRSFTTSHGDQVFNPAWILSANMFGDTAVTVGDYTFDVERTRDFIELSGYIKVGGFSFDIPTDTAWNISIDISAIAVLMGAFTNVENEPYMNAQVQFGSAGGDTQILACYGLVQDKDDATPNLLYFSGGQTDTGGVAGNTSLTVDLATIRFTTRFQVSD